MSEAYKADPQIKRYFKHVKHNFKKANHARVAPFFRWFHSTVSLTECSGLDRLKEERDSLPDDDKPIYIHLGRHLSELDWSETQYLFHTHGMEAMISMGHNLDVWPIGNLLKALGGFVAIREPCKLGDDEIDKSTANLIYNQYFHHVVLNEGHDILLYPEFTKMDIGGKMKRKYGRSYSGELLEFASHLFRLFQGIQRKTDKPIMVVPHAISRERVVEDQIFSNLKEMKKKGYGNESIFFYDMGFVYTHWLYQKKGKVALRFGEPIHVEGMPTKKLAEKAREEVARLSVLFPTHIFAYALDRRDEMSCLELERRVASAIKKADDAGLDVDSRNIDSTIDRAYSQFDQRTRRIVDFSNGLFRVKRQDVVQQYRNNFVSLERILRNKARKKRTPSRTKRVHRRTLRERAPSLLPFGIR